MIEFYPIFTIAPDFSRPPVFTFTDGRRDINLGATERYGIYDTTPYYTGEKQVYDPENTTHSIRKSSAKNNSAQPQEHSKYK